MLSDRRCIVRWPGLLRCRHTSSVESKAGNVTPRRSVLSGLNRERSMAARFERQTEEPERIRNRTLFHRRPGGADHSRIDNRIW